MPLVRYQIRNEFGLADPELYKGADKDDPEALLEGVAMAGLVGVLRQLGDLSEFAADVFHGLHEEVMATAARGHSLMARVQELEAEASSIEKAFLSQTDQSPFFNDTGVEWHPNLRAEENLITCGDLPRFVRDSYEECRGPPQLFLLDKFDVAGAGACLKRYTDPSVFKVEVASSGTEAWREKKIRKVKKKGSRWRNGGTPEVVPTSHVKLHQLFLEEHVENGHYDPARLVKLKRRQLNGSMFDLTPGKSYMEKFLGTPSPEDKVVCEASVNQSPLRLTLDYSSESGLEILEISTVSPARESQKGRESRGSSPTAEKIVLKSFTHELDEEVVTREMVKVPDPITDGEDGVSPYIIHKMETEDEPAVDGGRKTEESLEGDHSDDLVSEVGNYMDALASMESEMETDNECKPKDGKGYLKVGEHGTDSETNKEHLDVQSNFSDLYSFGNSFVSDDGKNSSKKGRSSFSYSDSLSNVSEHMPYDNEGVVEVFPCAREVLDAPLDESSVHEMQSTEFIFHNIMRSEEDAIPNTGEASCSSHLSVSNSLLPLSVPVGNTVVVSSQETVLDEPHSKGLNLGSESLKANQNTSDLPDSFIILSNSSQEYHRNSVADFSEGCPVEEVYHEDPNVFVCMSNVSHLEKEGGDGSANEMLPTDCADKINNKNFIEEKTDSPRLAISPPREQLPSSDLPEVAMDTGVTQLSESLVVVKPVEMDSEIKDVTAEKSGSVEPAEDDTIKEKCSDITVDVSQYENDLIQVDSKVDVVGKDSEGQNNYSDKLGFSDHVNLDEDVVVSPVAVATGANDVSDANPSAADLVNSLSSNLVDIQESLSGNQCHQKELDFNETVIRECCAELEKQKEAKQLDVAFTDENPSACKLVSDGRSNMDVLENVHESISFDQTLNGDSSDVANITTVLSSVNNDEWGTKDAHLRNCIDSSEHIFSFPVCNISEVEAAFEQQPTASQADQVPGECALEVMVEVNSELFELQHSPPCHIAESGIPSEQSQQLQSDQPTEYLQACEASPKSSNMQSEQIETSDMCQERCLDSSAKQEALPGLGLPMQSAGQEINGTVLYKNPFESAFSSFGLLPENLEEMPPLPPLPPMQWRLGKSLPAALASQGEWTDHGQDTSLPIQPFTADEEFQADSVSFATENMQPSNPFLCVTSDIQRSECLHAKSIESSVQPTSFSMEMPIVAMDSNSQHGSLLFEGTQNLNPFLNIPETSCEVPADNFLASRGNPVGLNSDHLTSVATVEPTQSEVDPGSSDNLQSKYLSQGTPQSVSEAKAPENSLQNAEGEDRNSFDKSILPPGKLEDQRARDVVTSHVKNSSLDAEGEERNSFDKSELPPVMLEDQPQQDMVTSCVKTTWSQTTLALPPTYEIGKPNGSKLPLPRNPLIDAVAAHKLRKVTERVHPQIGQKADERDSLLEQIRTKSFNLKPTAVTRPNIQGIQGPKTNLKVAALLEKANAIRQALTGSDEDNDSDSWSDS